MTAGTFSAFRATEVIRQLLMAGMLAGVFAALLAVLFARGFVEPQIDRAIAYDASAATAHGEMEEPELVSRATQRGTGLLVATLIYGAAFGGIFALTFAGLHGRVLTGSARGTALWLALAAFVLLCVIPQLKYPANPPAVGNHETIQLRTAAYFGMMLLSVLAASGATVLARRLSVKLASFDARLVGIVAYIVAMALLMLAMPPIDEVPTGFPAALLWQFRIGALGMQALLWIALGLLFGKFAERALANRR